MSEQDHIEELLKKEKEKTNAVGTFTGLQKKVDLSDVGVLKQLETLGLLGCTYEEMGYAFGVTKATIVSYMKDREGLFYTTYKKANAITKKSLRRTQINKALSGDNSMLIWLGKQILEQKDQIHNINTDVDFFTEGDEENMTLDEAAKVFAAEKDA